jgi:hypothetical protein
MNKIKTEEWRLLWLYYLNSMVIIQLNNNNVSEIFRITGGVKQGGPLSPKLYNIYISELVQKIEETNGGALINKLKISIIIYADDIVIISPLKIDLVKMLEATMEYMEMWKIKINIEKTNYLIFGKPKIKNTEIEVCGFKIEMVQSVNYLGIIFNKQLDSTEHIRKRNKINMISAYSLYNTGLFEKAMDSNTKSFIYNTYCRSSLLYGLDVIEISEKNYKMIRTDEGILLKRIIATNKCASTTKTYLSLNIRELIYTIIIMKLNLWTRLMNNKYTTNLISSIASNEFNFGKEENRYEDKSLIKEIKELKQLFNTDEFDTKSIKLINEKLKDLEKENIKNEDEINLIKYCIDNRYKNQSLNKTLSVLMDYKKPAKLNSLLN